MDEQQSVKMISWLDDERRKDKAVIVQLEAHSTGQQAVIEDLLRRIQTMESGLTALSSTAMNEENMANVLDGLRAEVQGKLQHEQERREKAERETKKLREVEHEGHGRAMADMRNELLARFERDLAPRIAAEERLNKIAGEVEEATRSFSRQSEDGGQMLDFLEEQRRLDSKRIVELQNEILESRKNYDSATHKLELVEALARRNERLGPDVEELRQKQQEWTEDESMVSHRREKMLTEMQVRLDAFQKQMDGYTQQVEGWGKTHVRMKKHVEEAEKTADRIDRRLNEVAELVRISADRLRQEWDAFNTEDSKRWKEFTLTSNEAWRENERKTEKYIKRIDEIVAIVEQHDSMLSRMLTLEKQYASLMGDHLQNVMDELGNNHNG